MVKAVKKCYTEYPTIVNNLQEGGIKYNNTLQEYAKMDIALAKSRRGIGESSNLAQLAMTYYWTDQINNSNATFKTLELYDNFVILSVIAQLIIDGSKKVYEVDGLQEIDRIKRMDCMNLTNQDGTTKDYPLFMNYVKTVPVTKNGKSLPREVVSSARGKIKNRINNNLICPMNYLQEHLNKIQGATKTNMIPTEDFFVRMRGRANPKQVSKIAKLAQEFDEQVKKHALYSSETVKWEEFIRLTEEYYARIAKIKINNIITINRVIEGVLRLNTVSNRGGDFNNLELHKYCKVILKALYKTNPEKFLMNFA